MTSPVAQGEAMRSVDAAGSSASGSAISASDSTATAAAALDGSPVAQGEALRAADEARQSALATMQRDNFPAYVDAIRPTLAPQDRNNPFAYSLDASIPIDVKRQVHAEWQSGANAPTVEVGPMSGANASFDETAGPNGTIRVNSDLLSANTDPTKAGQFEAFAVWGHMEEVGHWGDMRAQEIMGRPGGDSLGDEGARFAYMQTPGVVASAATGTFVGNYPITATDGTVTNVPVDTVVLRALAAEKLSSGSFARENRIGSTEHFGPEGHYQTTYITAAAVAANLGVPAQQADAMANRMALGSQLPDMLANYDAASQFKAKLADNVLDSMIASQSGGFTPHAPSWTSAEQRHLEGIYQGLHALPREANATTGWVANERVQTANYIQDRIAAGDFLTAGVAIHRYGDLHAHIQENGRPYSNDQGHLWDGHSPDHLYQNNNWGQAQSWNKPIQFQQSLSGVLANGIAGYQRNQGQTVSADQISAAANNGQQIWRGIYDGALSAAQRERGWFINGASAGRASEVYFRNSAEAFINRFNDEAQGGYRPLSIGQMEVGGGYSSGNSDIRSLNTVVERFRAQR